MLADVVGATSTAAVAFSDAKNATETLKRGRRQQERADGGHPPERHRVRALRSPAGDSSGRPFQPARSRERGQVDATFERDALWLVRPLMLDGELIGSVYIESGLDELNERRRRLISIIAVILTGALGIAFVLSWKLERLISEPILRLTAVTRVVSRDKNYDIRVEKTRQDEVGLLIDGFNEMLSEIQKRDRRLLDHQNALEQEVAVRTTDLRAANADLLTARDKAMEGSRAKSEFLANMSHEIRTPMNGIIGMTELALDSTLTVEQRECLKTVKLSAASLLALLNDILDFSKIESQKLELETIAFSVVDLVEDTLKPLALLAHQKGLELIADIAADVPAGIAGDPGRIGQILANLVGERHQVHRPRPRPGAGPCATSGWPIACGCTSPSAIPGIGIAADKHATIFEAFSQADGSTTRRFGGTGLGLTISSTLVHLMGGDISLESELDVGTTFHFTATFPLADLPAPEHPSGTERAALVDLPVLIVDDNEVNRRIFTDMLTRWQMKPAAVDSGAAALVALADACDHGTPFALILLDANMPEMDGFAVAERMAALPGCQAPTIMMLTSSGQFGDSTRCRDVGNPRLSHQADQTDGPVERHVPEHAPAGAP